MDSSQTQGTEIPREMFVWLLGSLHGLARLAFAAALILVFGAATSNLDHHTAGQFAQTTLAAHPKGDKS